MTKKLIGKVAHFYPKIGVAVVDITAELKKGDKISIEGPHTNIEQTADSMQIDKKPISVAKKGQSIGLQVADKVRDGDEVYKITE